jgi:hypothetical protein
MITLTLPRWTQNPREGIKFIRRSFMQLRRSAFFKGVAGGAYQIELKPKHPGWHIHLHALIESPFMPYQKLFAAWRKILGRQHVEVDIRAAGTPKEREYICKYAAKSANFDANVDTVVEWYRATKGQRLFGTWGKWYNATLQELDPTLEKSRPPPACPFCHGEHCVMLARDGSFYYEPDAWRSIRNEIVDAEGYIRDIPGVKAILKGTPA